MKSERNDNPRKNEGKGYTLQSCKILVVLACLAVLCLVVGCASLGRPSIDGLSGRPSETDASPLVIGVAWRPDSKNPSYSSVVDYFSSAGFEVVLLDKTTTPFLEYYEDGSLSDSNLNLDFSLSQECVETLDKACVDPYGIVVPSQLADVDLVVFSGGEDISPSLYGKPFDLESVDLSDTYAYNAERDVSDYLLMRYCMANDIPLLGICRGMQMLAVANGYRLIEDLPTYYAELNVSDPVVHRSPSGGTVLHEVFFEESDSHGLFEQGESFPVASFHHQAVDSSSFDAPGVSFLAFDTTGDVRIAEAMELEDKTFAIGLQFHMEYFFDHPLEPGAERSRAFVEALHSVIGSL